MPDSPARLRLHRFGGILLLIVLIRVYDGLTENTSWRVRIYDSTVWWVILSSLAIFTAGLTAGFVRPRVARPTTILVAALIGSATTLATSSVSGMVIGGVIGFLISFDTTRWLVVVLSRAFVSAILPAGLIGMVVGLVGSVAFFEMERSFRWMVQLRSLLVLVSCFTLWFGLTKRRTLERSWIIGLTTVFLISLMAFIPMGIQLDTLRRIRLLGDAANVSLQRVPFGSQMLTRGIWDVDRYNLIQDSMNDQAAYARGFPYATTVGIAYRSRITDEGLQRLNLRAVSEFLCAENPAITDKGFHVLKASTEMRGLHLGRANISDEGLRILRGMRKLAVLNLSNTRINGSGLKNLHKDCPLTHLDLAHTNVDDGALAYLTSFRLLRTLDLRGTRVRGQGLRQLGSSPMLDRLILSDTDLQEQYLAELAACRVLRVLVIDDVQLTREGIKNIAAVSSLNHLAIPAAIVDDESIILLKRLKRLQFLSVGANKLTPVGYQSVSHLRHVNLVYDARFLPLNEIVKQYQQLVASKWESAKQSNLFLSIRHLDVDSMQMLAEVDKLQSELELELDFLRYLGSEQHEGRYLSLDTIRNLIAQRGE